MPIFRSLRLCFELPHCLISFWKNGGVTVSVNFWCLMECVLWCLVVCVWCYVFCRFVVSSNVFLLMLLSMLAASDVFLCVV